VGNTDVGTGPAGSAGDPTTSVTGSGQGGTAATTASTSVGAGVGGSVGAGTGGSTGGNGGSSGGTGPVADASAGAGGSGGTAGTTGTGGTAVDAGNDIRDAAVEPRVDAPIDAPPEASCGSATQCALKAGLVHRYTFTGTGTAVTDSVGTANGTVMNTTLAGNGTLVLAAGSNQYVDLPNGIIKSLTNASFEFWVTWGGGAQWQRLFDFGNTTGAENTQGTASTSFYFTPLGGGPTMMFAAFKRSDVTGPNETRAIGAGALPTTPMLQLTVVVDDANNQLLVYRNGTVDGMTAFTDSLSLLTDVNNWIGRSQYADPGFGGTLHEFRIYNVALTQAQVQAAFAGGTDPTFLN
jgi:hypothetical protein